MFGLADTISVPCILTHISKKIKKIEQARQKRLLGKKG